MRLARALAVLLVLAPASASAFCRTTVNPGSSCDDKEAKPLYWASKCAGFVVQSERTLLSPDPLRDLDQAFTLWQGKLCGSGDRAENPSMKLLLFGTQSSLRVGYLPGGASQNVVVFGNAPGGGSLDQLGRTTLSFSKTTGEILDADLEVFFSDGTIDLASILAHESGHLLGLAHSDDPESTMLGTTEQGETKKRSLALDDATAVCSVYPPSGERATAAGLIPATACNLQTGKGSPCATTVSGGCAQGSGSKTDGAWLVVAATCALVIQRGRRRKG
jgi:hypothetical protein